MRIRAAVRCAALIAIVLAGVGATFLSEVRGVVLDPNGSHLLDNSLLLGGTHWVEPRQVSAELRYRFHY